MKKLYLDIIERLDDNEALETLPKKLFTGQVANPDTEMPALPCILIDFPYTYYKDASARIQKGDAMVKLLLCFDASEINGTGESEVTYEEMFDLKDKVYTSLQGLKLDPPSVAPVTSGYTPLVRGGERTETKYEGLYVFEIDFYTTIIDTGIYMKKIHVNARTYSSDTYPLPGGIREIEASVNVNSVAPEEE